MQLRRRRIAVTPLDDIMNPAERTSSRYGSAQREEGADAGHEERIDLTRALDQLAAGFRVTVILADASS